MMRELYVRVALWRARVSASEEGATAVEYALMIGLIALVIVAAVTFMGESTNSKFETPALLDALT